MARGIESKEVPSIVRVDEIQDWFGKTIQAPHFFTNEADDYIVASATMKPTQRIALYHEQYWWRLLNALQKNFPAVTRSYGYEAFNQEVGIPYLSAYPPHHWSLCRLGESLPLWIEAPFVQILAALDWAAGLAFWEKERAHAQNVTAKTVLQLQSYISLFSFDCDYFSFRDTFLKQEVSYYYDHPFPFLERRPGFFVVFRNFQNEAVWKEISLAEYTLLRAFQKGCSIEEGCRNIEEMIEEEEKIAFWFKEWTALGWFFSLQ
ncbi:MAG: DNA-binding domain-containing protein [Chlamydiales bacterium]